MAWIHRLSNIDTVSRKAQCAHCGLVSIRKHKSWWRCNIGHASGNRPWAKHKKNYCEQCGFKAKHRVQLDVDHIDGNNANNDPSNYQTLCANCHRLKTYLNKDWENKK